MWETKNALFLVSKQEAYVKRGRGRRIRGRKGKSSQGMETKSFCMDSCIHDFGIVFVQEFLGYDC